MFVDVSFIEMFKRFHSISHIDLVVTSNFVPSLVVMLCFCASMKVHGILVGGKLIKSLR